MPPLILKLGNRGEGSASRSGRFTARVSVPGTHLIGGYVAPRAGLDGAAKRKNRTSAPAGNLTPVVQPVAYSLY
jgi:hypothetical protein